MEANIETRESTREKARAVLGLDLSEKKKGSKASNAFFNAILRGQM